MLFHFTIRSLLCASLFSSHASAVQLMRQRDGKLIDLTHVPGRRLPSTERTTNSSSSALILRDQLATLAGFGLDKRQYCSDPAYPYHNSCTAGRCCPAYAPACCPDTGDCLDSTNKQCCSGGQCDITAACCGYGCCPGNRECCGDPNDTIGIGCCYVGEKCYQYTNGPYIGEFTCLTPAEASEIFDTIGTTSYGYSTSFGNNQQLTATVAAPLISSYTSSVLEITAGAGGIATSSSYGNDFPVSVPTSSVAPFQPGATFSSGGPRAGDEDCPGGLIALNTGGFSCIGVSASSGSGPTAAASGFSDQGGSAESGSGGSGGNAGNTLGPGAPEMVLLSIAVGVGALVVVL